MGNWIRDLSLKYKFWAVNAVAFVTTLLLVLYALQAEHQARIGEAQSRAQAQARMLMAWPPGLPFPAQPSLVAFTSGDRPSLPDDVGQHLSQASGWVALPYDAFSQQSVLIGAQMLDLGQDRRLAVLAHAPSLRQMFSERAPGYALVVALLMLSLLGASQLLIRFLLTHLNTLKDVMLQVEKSGDLAARVPLDCRDEVGQMATAFNAMQAGYQRVVGRVAEVAGHLDSGADQLASSMHQVRQGMLAQQSQSTQAVSAIQAMFATAQQIAQHTRDTRDRSRNVEDLARSGQQEVSRVAQSIAELSGGVQQTAQMIERLAVDSQTISGVVGEIHGIAEQTNLLALNAAIEAARAGEMGRGFAVVADEVRNLAKRVQASTAEISRMIAALQGGTRDAVEFMRESSADADRCVRQADQAGQALLTISAAVTQMRESNTQIAAAAEQQSQVVEGLNRAVAGSRDVTEQTVLRSTHSAATSGELAALAADLTSAIRQLRL
ncbi:MAG: methyl-accepting chemotaxis protein [Pseudomonas sp.]|uniref:methyl-accepting chemotaxis protein n=1 Tax=Pseudomonas sp. TaxID=306 RepID=UPI0033912EE9